MNFKNQWIWVLIAVALLGFILVQHRFKSPPQTGPGNVIGDLRPSAVTSVQVRPQGQLEIRAQRVGDAWDLTAPVAYPAQSASIEHLLQALAKLTAVTCITAAELKSQPKADEDYGFTNPQASLIIRQPEKQFQVLIGTLTAPGDQVFVQLVGVEAVHVVDAELLKLIPRSSGDWRDTALLRLKNLAFDNISVTHAARTLQFQKVGNSWRMTAPIEARADNARLQECLQRLDSLEVSRYVSDDANTDLENFGLQPADLEITLKAGTNTVALLQFGKSPTNNPAQIFARRSSHNSVLAVAREPLTLWRGSAKDFREPHIIGEAHGVNAVDIHSTEPFSLLLQASNTWRVMPQNFPADASLVRDFLANLSGMRIVEFTKDVVTPIDFTNYGLATPVSRYTLKVPQAASSTNTILAELNFGTTESDRVFVRRSDETSVYAVNRKDFEQLPVSPVQMRERQIWNFSENEVSQLTIRQQGKVRQIVRKGQHSWSLAAGSQGMINDLAIEESVRPLCRLAATAWVARGEQSRERYGLGENSLQLTLDLKSGEKRSVSFGSAAPNEGVYAGVQIEGEFWIFEFSSAFYRFVSLYLTIPADQP